MFTCKHTHTHTHTYIYIYIYIKNNLLANSSQISKQLYGNLKWLKQKIGRQRWSVIFNQICLYKEMLPKYPPTHTCVCVCIYIYIYTHTHTHLSSNCSCEQVLFNMMDKDYCLISLSNFSRFLTEHTQGLRE